MADPEPLKTAADAGPQEKVDLGKHVEIELADPEGEVERLAFDLVPDEQADFYYGLLGISTPLAKAILGQRVGSVVNYRSGERYRVRILSVRPIDHENLGAAAERRKAAQDAVKQAERTTALIFATSVDSKWGDYDADGMIENWD